MILKVYTFIHFDHSSYLERRVETEYDPAHASCESTRDKQL